MALFSARCYSRAVEELLVIVQRTAVACLGLLMAVSSWTLRAAESPSGETLYNDTCRRCHGEEGRGAKGPQLVPFKLSYEKALDRIRHPECEMPAFSEDELSDADVAMIVAYLKTIKK